MAISSILIANRGEIACRIMRTASNLGLRTIAVYSTADANAPHVGMADEAICIGAPPATESYLDGDKIITAAKESGADAIHPGYGFLSENADFATAVEAAGLVFIGPTSDAIRAMGNKAEAKRLMIKAGVPCVPGYEGDDQSDTAFTRAAKKIGFPVMIKAAAGGGGRGMREVHDARELKAALGLARSEAENAFGSDEMILEKAITDARHVEIQIFADTHGNCIHLGERDCSVQRRHQKIIEEAPCPIMTPELRDAMGEAAVTAAQSVGYRGAGTVEFLLDNNGGFYFLEMNTRLQVEHPVTECVSGIDLVALQIDIANGNPLPLKQNEVAITGHAIEARLYAEDPAKDFLPAIGSIHLWRPASGEGVRIDSGITQGQEITPYYDPMLAKIIASGPSREAARTRLIRALSDTVLLGPATNTGFLTHVLTHEDFVRGTATTDFLARAFPDGIENHQPDFNDIAIAAAMLLQTRQARAYDTAGYVSVTQLGWNSTAPLPIPLELSHADTIHALTATVNGDEITISDDDNSALITIQSIDEKTARFTLDGKAITIFFAMPDINTISIAHDAKRFTMKTVTAGGTDSLATGGDITAPMPGLVIGVSVKKGDAVKRGAVLAVLEAMKMQHQITAPIDGIVSVVEIKKGQQVASGDRMILIEKDGKK